MSEYVCSPLYVPTQHCDECPMYLMVCEVMKCNHMTSIISPYKVYLAPTHTQRINNIDRLCGILYNILNGKEQIFFIKKFKVCMLDFESVLHHVTIKFYF